MKRSYFAGLILMLALAYPLSLGPVIRITFDPRNHFTEETKERTLGIYEPVLRVPFLQDFLLWYVTLCTRDLETIRQQ